MLIQDRDNSTLQPVEMSRSLFRNILNIKVIKTEQKRDLTTDDKARIENTNRKYKWQ